MRIVKEAEERKEEILDVAEKLFGTKGFDHTSTNDILEGVGIARGTLYYHFRSKEEILDAVIERLTKAVMSLNVESQLGLEVMEQVHRPQNALMHQKMQKLLLAGIDPLLTELVEEGIGQGICHTKHPAEAVEMTMLYANTAFDELDMAGVSAEERQKKMAAFIYNTERLLGMEEGSLQGAIMEIFAASRLG